MPCRGIQGCEAEAHAVAAKLRYRQLKVFFALCNVWYVNLLDAHLSGLEPFWEALAECTVQQLCTHMFMTYARPLKINKPVCMTE